MTLFALTVVNNWFIIMVRTEILRETCKESDFLLILKNGFLSKKMNTWTCLCIIISRSDELLCRKLGTKKTENAESTSRIALTLDFLRAVTKISSCRVNTTSKRGFKQLGISFGSIFLLFSCESSRGNPRPPPFNDSPAAF